MKAFDYMERVEARIGDLYRHLEKVFAADHGAAVLFINLAMDEDSHKQSVIYQRRIVRNNKALLKQAQEVEFDLITVERMLVRIDGLIASKAKPTLKQAVQVSLEIEGSAAELHHRTVIAKVLPEVAELVKSLGASDEVHLETIKRFAAERKLL